MQRGKYLPLVALTGAAMFAMGMAQPAHGAGGLPPSTALPAGWSEVNLTTGSGNLSLNGPATDPKTVWTTNVIGGDIQGTADRGYFAYTPLPGDGGITARLLTQVRSTPGDWMKTGVMLRGDITPGSPMAALNQATGQSGAEYLFRIKQNANAGDVQGGPFGRDLSGGPIWFRAQRQGQNYQVLLSDDGQRWRLIKGATLPLDATKPVLAGFDGSTASATVSGTTTYDNVSVTANVVQPAPDGPTGLQSLPGNGEVLLTFSTVPNATGYNIYRRQAGDPVGNEVKVNAKSTPYGWFIDDGAGKGLTNDTHFVYAVRAVYGTGASATESLDSGAVLAEPQVPIAPGFRSYDIGTLTPGSTVLDNGVLTITASGRDITGTGPDGFRFVAMARDGDYSISAKLLEKPGQDPNNKETYVKAGVMIRESLDPASAAAWCVGTTGQGVLFEHRSGYATASVNDPGTAVGATTFPQFVKLTKAGDNISAFQSADGTTYKQIGKAVTFPGMSALPFTYAGLAVTAHKDTTIVTAKFAAASVNIQ